MAAWPRPFSSAPGGVDDDLLGGVVALLDLGRAGELQLDRSHADGDLAAVAVGTESAR